MLYVVNWSFTWPAVIIWLILMISLWLPSFFGRLLFLYTDRLESFPLYFVFLSLWKCLSYCAFAAMFDSYFYLYLYLYLYLYFGEEMAFQSTNFFEKQRLLETLSRLSWFWLRVSNIVLLLLGICRILKSLWYCFTRECWRYLFDSVNRLCRLYLKSWFLVKFVDGKDSYVDVWLLNFLWLC